MKIRNTSTKPSGAIISFGVIVAICAVVAITRADAVIVTTAQSVHLAPIRPAVIFTVNPGQTARINVIAPTQTYWGDWASRRMLLGFDVYRSNGTSPRLVGDTTCAKYHMVERKACEVMLTPGEAASFDFAVPSDGVATQISPVFSLEGNDADGALRSGDLVPTIEMREGGRTTGILLLPAVQR
jgi:hypothetical protein